MSDFPAYRKTPRLYKPMVVTEKIDGTNALVSVEQVDDLCMRGVVDGEVVAVVEDVTYVIRAGSRKRWITPSDDNYGFSAWVWEHADELALLGPGLHYGEWWGKGIQRGYGLDERRFSLFNVGRWQDVHGTNPGEGPSKLFAPECCHVVPVMATSSGFFDHVVKDSLKALQAEGSAAAQGYMRPEGVVAYHAASNQVFKAFPDDLTNQYYGRYRIAEPVPPTAPRIPELV